MGILIEENRKLKICDLSSNEMKRRPAITATSRVVKIPSHSSYLDIIQKKIKKIETMSKSGTSIDWMLCYNGGDNPAVVAECYYGKSKVVFQEPLFEKFKEDIYE